MRGDRSAQTPHLPRPAAKPDFSRCTDRIRQMLDEIGVGGERLKMVNLSAAMAPTFVQRVHEIVETVKALGPSPLRESVGAQ